MTFRSGRGRATTRVAPTGAEGRGGGGWVPAWRGFLLPCSLGQALRGNNGWGGRFVAFGMTFRSGRGRATTRVAPTGAEGRGGGWVPACARTREGDEGDGFLLPCSRGQALRGNNGWGGRFVAFGMTFRSGRGRATTRVAPTGAEGRGGGWVPACARTRDTPKV